MNNYFGMDSFNRDCTEAETVYCANSVSGMRSRGIEVLPQTAQITTASIQIWKG